MAAASEEGEVVAAPKEGGGPYSATMASVRARELELRRLWEVCERESESLWEVKNPLKIKMFLWQLDNNRLQTAVSLKHRGRKGSRLCVLC